MLKRMFQEYLSVCDATSGVIYHNTVLCKDFWSISFFVFTLSWISLRNLEYFYQEIPFWDYYDIWNCIFHHLPIVNQGILNLTKCTSGRFIDLVHMESDSVTEQATAGTQVSKRSSWYSGYVHHMTSSTGQTRRLSGVHDFWEGGK